MNENKSTMNDILQSARSLLDSTTLIRKQAETLNRVTGGQFNLFRLLRLNGQENCHSLLLAEILNSKGAHGQGAVFWEAFKEVLGDIKPVGGGSSLGERLSGLTGEQIGVKTEHHLGSKTETSGGRVDIAIECTQQALFIENKIYARLQEQQLERYLGTGHPVIFLTLSEQDFEENQLPENPNLYRVTYKTHIRRWLLRCIELSATIPPVRESLSQYLTCVEELTIQGGNHLMQEQLKTIITRDSESIKAFFELRQCEAAILNSVGERFLETGRFVAEQLGLELLEKTFDYTGKYQGLSFQCNTWTAHNLQVGVQFCRNLQDLFFGVAYIQERTDDASSVLALRIADRFRSALGEAGNPNSWWTAYQFFSPPWRNWGPEEYANMLVSQPSKENPGAFGQLLLDNVREVKTVLDEALSES